MLLLREILTVARSPIKVAMVATLQQNDQPCDQAPETHDETDRRPMPMIQVHRGRQRHCSDQQIEIRQTFVDWFGHPHID